jgi:hypothetical protein
VSHTPARDSAFLRYNPRWVVAERISDSVRRKWGMEVQAIGVNGSVAHGDDTDGSDVGIVVITKWPGTGLRPSTRRIDGIIVDIGVISSEEYLKHARTLTTSWPLTADRYLTTKALHDPDVWLPTLRDAHLARLARAGAGEFAALAREAWCRALTAHHRAGRLVEWFDTDSAMLVLGEARLAVALVEGLLTRTYFRNSADAVKRVGVAAADITELSTRLSQQAEELAKRGKPVDGDVSDLL